MAQGFTRNPKSNALLDGVIHTDTLAGTVARGDIIIANATPKWARVAKGAANTVLASDGTDAAWDATPGVEGLAFPATQVASANANTLDDYEEGTWTPVLGGVGGTTGQAYTSQWGTYTKVGRVVTVLYRLQLSTLGTLTGSVEIQGLPFTIISAAGGQNAPSPLNWNNNTTAYIVMQTIGAVNTTTLPIRALAAASVTLNAVVQADMSNTQVLSGSFTYFTNP